MQNNHHLKLVCLSTEKVYIYWFYLLFCWFAFELVKTTCVHFQPRNHFRRGSIRSVWSYTDQTTQIRFLFEQALLKPLVFLFLSYYICFTLLDKQINQFSAEFPSPRQPHYLGQEANTFKVLSAKRQHHYHNYHHHHPHHNHYPHS